MSSPLRIREGPLKYLKPVKTNIEFSDRQGLTLIHLGPGPGPGRQRPDGGGAGDFNLSVLSEMLLGESYVEGGL